MRRLTSITAILVLASFVAGCSDRYEKNEKEHLELLEELNEALATVTDPVSLELALPQLEELNRRIKSNIEEREAMDDPPKERARELENRYSGKLGLQSGEFGGHMKRIEKIDADRKSLREKRFKAMKDIPPDY